jgi:hypothetical protein
MRLTPPIVASLPLAAAVIGPDNGILAQTPEWTGPGLGTVAYGAGSSALLVTPLDQDGQVTLLVDELLTAMRRASDTVAAEFRARLTVVAAALEVIVGRRPSGSGTVGEALALTSALSPFHPDTQLSITRHGVSAEAPISSPAAVAMALHQLVRNASGHDRASNVMLTVSSVGPSALTFEMNWTSRVPGVPSSVRTSRVLSRRVAGSDALGRVRHQGWGLGYVSVAADALSAVRTGPMLGEDGVMRVTLDFGVPRLMLPIACVEGCKIEETTPGWDSEELRCPTQGSPTTVELDRVVRDSEAAKGQIVAHGAWLARTTGSKTWIALPPDGMKERARDLLVGCSHERATWNVAEPVSTIVNALLVLVSLAAGQPAEEWLVLPTSWPRYFSKAAEALGLTATAPPIDGPALDPTAVAYLMWRYGSGWSKRDGLLTMRVKDEFAADPVLAVLGARDGELVVEASPALLTGDVASAAAS